MSLSYKWIYIKNKKDEQKLFHRQDEHYRFIIITKVKCMPDKNLSKVGRSDRFMVRLINKLEHTCAGQQVFSKLLFFFGYIITYPAGDTNDCVICQCNIYGSVFFIFPHHGLCKWWMTSSSCKDLSNMIFFFFIWFIQTVSNPSTQPISTHSLFFLPCSGLLISLNFLHKLYWPVSPLDQSLNLHFL